MEALWQEAKQYDDRDPPAVPRSRNFGDGRRAAEDHLGLRRYRTAAAALFRGGEPRSAARCSGAYDGERMVGFCSPFPGIKPGGRPYLHSHMLGVLPEYRNAGSAAG